MALRYLSISQLSEITGKDRRTISDRLSDVKAHSADGRAQYYDTREVLPIILVEKTVAGIEKKLQRIELETAEETLQKLKLANGKTTGELASIEEVAETVEREYSYVRAQLRSLPSRMAKPLSMVTDPGEVFTQLTDAINEALSELSADKTYDESRRDLEAVRASIKEGSKQIAQAESTPEPSGVGGPEEISE